MQSVAVFCGANLGHAPIFSEKAAELGRTLAARNIRVVFGGGSVGLMGVVADAVLAAGGPITGIITHQLNSWEVGHAGVEDMVVVESMSERRALLLKGTDGVITLPGGYGSMDELFEALTLAQLQQYPRPVGLLNVEGYYDPLLTMLDRMVERGFLKESNRQLCIVGETIPELLDRMAAFEHRPELKWM